MWLAGRSLAIFSGSRTPNMICWQTPILMPRAILQQVALLGVALLLITSSFWRPTRKKAAALVDQLIAELGASLKKSSIANPIFQSSLSYVRRHRNSATFAPWHLDAYAAGTLNHDP